MHSPIYNLTKNEIFIVLKNFKLIVLYRKAIYKIYANIIIFVDKYIFLYRSF